MPKHTDIKTEMAKALIRFSGNKLSETKAAELSEKAALIFAKAIEENEILAHKGLNWYAKELLKSLKLPELA